jgi:Ca2+-binding EF-hand superfamily protein
MLRQFCVLSVAGLLALVPNAVAAGGQKVGQKKPAKPDPVTAAFKKSDANNDGQLSRDEFTKFMEQRKPKAEGLVKDKKVNALFDVLDVDQNGSLSLDEFKRAGELLKVKKGK